jgi:hypothetical protein
MADVIKSVRAYLLTKTAITDLVGQSIYASKIPQSLSQTSNCVVIDVNSEVYDHTIDGLGGIVSTRLNIDCFASTSEIARSIADAIIWSGIDAIKGTYTSLNIRSVMVDEGRREYLNEDIAGGDNQRHVVTFDLMVHWLRT